MDARDLACATKVRHPSRSAAKKALKAVKRSRNARHLAVYDCWYCDGFHVGNLPGHQTGARKGLSL